MRRTTLFLIPLLFLLLFFAYPVASLLYLGLWDGSFTLDYMKEAFSRYGGIIWFTVYQALLSSIITLAIGLPGAYIMGNYSFRGKGFIKAVSTVPFILPSIIVVLGFLGLFGNNGLLNHLLEPFGIHISILYTLTAILLAHAFYNFPIVMRMVGSAWENLDSSYEDAARTLGAGPLQRFVKITLPLLSPSIISAFTLVFAYCFMSFAIVLILGGAQYTTIEVEIYFLATVLIRPHMASALALVQIAISLIFIWVYTRFGKEGASGTRQMKKMRWRSPSGILISAYSILVAFLILAPMLSVVYYSFVTGWGGSFTTHWYSLLFSEDATGVLGIPLISVLKNSLLFAAITVLITVPLAILSAFWARRHSRYVPLIMVSVAVSSVTLGWAYIGAFLGTSLYGTWWIIALAHSVIAFPLVFRSVYNSVASMDDELRYAARTLGAGPLRAFLHAELPQILPGIVVGASFAFAISIGEFGATLLLYRPEYTTIPIAIYRILGTRAFGSAAAMSTLLMLLAAASFLLIDRLGVKQERSAF